MGSGYSKKKKQAKMFQQQLSRMQEEMLKKEAAGTAGGGLVTITLNGEHAIKDIKIKPDCVDPEDIEGLEDLIKAAHKDALKKLQESAEGGMPNLGNAFPGMF